MAFTFTGTDYNAIEDGERYGEAIKRNSSYGEIFATVTFDGNQSDGNYYKLFHVYGNDIITGGGYYNTALAGMTDVDIGLYKTDGTVVDADFFVDGDSLATAQTARYGDSILSATNVSAAGDEQTILADLDTTNLSRQEEYVVALTVNTAGSASGSFFAKFEVKSPN